LEVLTAFDILEIGAEEVEVAVVLDCLVADVLVPLREIVREMAEEEKCQNFNICVSSHLSYVVSILCSF
jgi:hypothetical protein